MPGQSRRTFFKICTSLAAILANATRASSLSGSRQRYEKSTLVNDASEAIKAPDIKEGETYLFFYPYISTPCFLLNTGEKITRTENLKTASGEIYRYPNGVGENQAIVAFSAICTHRMSHPAPSVSFINYRHQATTFFNSNNQMQQQKDKVIYCCSEKSVYDVRRGAAVVSGPAPQPLTAIQLREEPDTGVLSAIGTVGGEKFAEYFQQFSHRLVLQFRSDDIVRPSGKTAKVITMAEYCNSQVLC